MKVDFSAMNKAELRAYVIENPNDQIAFQNFVDRYTAEATSKTYPMAESQEEVKEIDNLIRQKVARSKSI